MWICTICYIYVYAMSLDMYNLDNRMLCMFTDDDLRFPNRPI